MSSKYTITKYIHLSDYNQNIPENENADILCKSYELDFIDVIGEVRIIILQSENNKLPALLLKYVCIFVKSKYDVGHINMELQRIHLIRFTNFS